MILFLLIVAFSLCADVGILLKTKSSNLWISYFYKFKHLVWDILLNLIIQEMNYEQEESTNQLYQNIISIYR